jgi:four helix bundle protein
MSHTGRNLSQPFAHESLQVYAKALAFTGRALHWLSGWDKKHAVVDQLSRATESMVLNLAEAARQRGRPARLQSADYALGSSLECAGCLDIAGIKELLPRQECQHAKASLCEITRMLVGLRKAWDHSVLHEPSAYLLTSGIDPVEPLFHHERLEVYQIALGFMGWFLAQPAAKTLAQRLFRRVDEAGTSIVLNIAEGNGRFAELDHHRFLQVADSSAVKAAVYLDLCVERGLLGQTETALGTEMLRRVSSMLAGF